VIIPFGSLGGLFGQLRGLRRDRQFGDHHARANGELDLLRQQLQICKECGIVMTPGQAANAIREIAPDLPLARALGRARQRQHQQTGQLQQRPGPRQIEAGERPETSG
jgi:hypothetical protein